MVLVPAQPSEDRPPPAIWAKFRGWGHDRGGPVRLDLIVMDVVDGLASIGIGAVVTVAFWLVAGFTAGPSGTTGVLDVVFGGVAVGVMSVPVAFLTLIALTFRGVGPGIAVARHFAPSGSGTRGWGAVGARIRRYVTFLFGIALVGIAFPGATSLLGIFVLGLPVGALLVAVLYYLDH